MSAEKNDNIPDLSLLKLPTHRQEVMRLYKQLLRKERDKYSPRKQTLCFVCRARPRKARYCYCHPCLALKSAIDRVLKTIPQSLRPTGGLRLALLRGMSAQYGAEIHQMLRRRTAVYVGLQFPPEYFRQTRKLDAVNLFSPRNILIFDSLGDLRAHGSFREQRTRQNQRSFKAWLRQQPKPHKKQSS